MEDQYRTPLTEEQRQALKPTLDKIEQSVGELATKLTEMGRIPREEPGEDHCFFCSCTSFVGDRPRPNNLHGFQKQCGRQSCRHSYIAHLT